MKRFILSFVVVVFLTAGFSSVTKASVLVSGAEKCFVQDDGKKKADEKKTDVNVSTTNTGDVKAGCGDKPKTGCCDKSKAGCSKAAKAGCDKGVKTGCDDKTKSANLDPNKK